MEIDALYLFQLFLNGVMLGLIYALIAVGLALIFGVMEIINFAHGELMMLGAYAMALIVPAVGLLYLPALIGALLFSAAAGWLLYEGLLSRLGPREFDRSILITMGLSMILLYGMQYVMSANPILVDTQFGFEGLEIGTVRITWTRVAAAGLACVAFVALHLILTRTQMGRAMRALAQNREAALMVGIRPRKVARDAVMLAAALSGLAGAALAPIQIVQPIMGQHLIFKAFALVIIGGLGNIPGAIAAAVGLGLLESFIGGFFEIVWQEVAVFVVMMLVLVFRPNGLFGGASLRVG